MADYRAFVVDPDGQFISLTGLVCDDDSEAIENARQLVDGHAVELWSGERLVIRLHRKPK